MTMRSLVVRRLGTIAALLTALVGMSTPASAKEPWARTSIPTPGGNAGGQFTAIGCWSIGACIVGGSRGRNAATFTETTTDGGRSWRFASRFPPPLAGGVASIACDRRGCLMVGENLAETADALGFSRNHGSSWSVIRTPTQWASQSITPDVVGCSAVSCLVYGSNVFAISTNNPSMRYRVAIIATSNEGRAWSPAVLPAGTNELDSIACIPSGRCLALYRGLAAQEGVAVTINDGMTWTSVGRIGQEFNPDHLGGFGCDSRLTCYVVNDSDLLFASHNGGSTWEAANSPRSVAGSTDLETDGLGCAPTGSTCYIVDLGSFWTSHSGPH